MGYDVNTQLDKNYSISRTHSESLLFQSGGILFPVAALNLVLQASLTADMDGPMFVYKPGDLWKPYLYNHFGKQLKLVLKNIGMDPLCYACHSLRRGGATWALRCGVPGEVIKAMGDWRSDAYLRYLDVTPNLKLNYVEFMSPQLSTG